MSYHDLLYEVRDQVARITINRPKQYNAFTGDTLKEMVLAVEAAGADPEVGVVVLSGAGDRAFCAGGDVTWEKEGGLERMILEPYRFHETLSHCPKPIIARVNGFAVGGGFEMVLGCDIVVACEDAEFGFPEPRVGRMPLDGGMVLLPRLAPEKWAMGVLLTGRRVPASEAHRMGLVNEVVPRKDLDGAVDRWVTEVLACAPLSLRAIKQLVKRTPGLTPEQAQALRLPAVVAALSSEDAEEGVRAFRERRAPKWSGC